MPAPCTTVIASSVGTGATVNLDWTAAGPITVRLTAVSSTAGAGCRLEMTLNDPMTFPSTGVIWTGLSSQGTTTWRLTSSLSSGSLILSSVIMDSQLIYQFATLLAAIRLNCSGAAANGGMRMDVMQGKSF